MQIALRSIVAAVIVALTARDAAADVNAATAPLELNATSDSGLPVEYYVAHGPATIEQGRLMLHELPRRARLPIEAKVVAYQFGRGVEPRVQAAPPVGRILRVR